MPPRRERRPGEGPQQPRCHYPGHHNTFIFSGLTGFETGRYSRAVGQSGATLTPQQLLLVTLIVRIAAVSLLAVMVVRYHRFRDLLIHERRGWPMKFFFAFSLRPGPDGGRGGAPAPAATTGSTSRWRARSWPGSSPARGAARWSGPCWARPALIAREWAALPFAVGCGFAAGGIREACPEGSDLALLAVRARRRAPLRLADLPALRGRLADRPALGADGAATPAAAARPPVADADLRARAPRAVPDGDGLPRRRFSASRPRSRSGTTPASSTGSASRRSCS